MLASLNSKFSRFFLCISILYETSRTEYFFWRGMGGGDLVFQVGLCYQGISMGLVAISCGPVLSGNEYEPARFLSEPVLLGNKDEPARFLKWACVIGNKDGPAPSFEVYPTILYPATLHPVLTTI